MSFDSNQDINDHEFSDEEIQSIINNIIKVLDEDK